MPEIVLRGQSRSLLLKKLLDSQKYWVVVCTCEKAFRVVHALAERYYGPGSDTGPSDWWVAQEEHQGLSFALWFFARDKVPYTGLRELVDDPQTPECCLDDNSVIDADTPADVLFVQTTRYEALHLKEWFEQLRDSGSKQSSLPVSQQPRGDSPGIHGAYAVDMNEARKFVLQRLVEKRWWCFASGSPEATDFLYKALTPFYQKAPATSYSAVMIQEGGLQFQLLFFQKSYMEWEHFEEAMAAKGVLSRWINPEHEERAAAQGQDRRPNIMALGLDSEQFAQVTAWIDGSSS